MRIWYVDFAELDNQRVVAQHSEVHAIWTLVTKRGHGWKEYGKPEHRLALWEVHERSVEEMHTRGYHGHQTPIDRPEIVVSQQPVTVDDKVLERERWQLICRNAGKYLGRPDAMHADYKHLITRYQTTGCLHDDVFEEIRFEGQKYRLCLTCKRWKEPIRDRR